MALPTSGAISMADVMTELRIANPSRAYPISLGDADVRNLAGVASGPISLSNLYGKSSFVVTGASDTATRSTVGGAGTCSCFPSVNVIGGAAPITYSWSFVSNPNSCTLVNQTIAQCTVGHTYAINTDGNASATVQCVVSDSAGNSRTVTATATLSWYSNR